MAPVLTTPPMTTDHAAVEAKQPFERHPALASWIERMANTNMGLSLGEWMVFLAALNDALEHERPKTLDALRSLGWTPPSPELSALCEAAREWYLQPYEGGNAKDAHRAASRRHEALLTAAEAYGRLPASEVTG